MAEVNIGPFSFTLEELETPPCRKCKNRVCKEKPSNCNNLIEFMKKIKGE